MDDIENKKKISLISLGCSKNLIDSEILLNQLEKNGIQILHNSFDDEVSIVIINTCGFINDAKQESIDTILQYIEVKKAGKIKELYVTG